MSKEEYINFMYNPDNRFNCSECPENHNFDDHEGKLPCGQQNCWVDCHCKGREGNMSVMWPVGVDSH